MSYYALEYAFVKRDVLVFEVESQKSINQNEPTKFYTSVKIVKLF